MGKGEAFDSGVVIVQARPCSQAEGGRPASTGSLNVLGAAAGLGADGPQRPASVHNNLLNGGGGAVEAAPGSGSGGKAKPTLRERL